MKIQMHGGLPLVSISLVYKGNTILLEHVLLDTGCSTTIFDTDEVEEVGLTIDRKNGRPKRMYGVGGESELCYEQTVYDLEIDHYKMDSFQLQLGITKETYGFNGILGVDFMTKSNLIIDFKDMKVKIK
ncbi:retropepsin-like domain-containing protein [Aquibacillus sp. 3ASR75-11]|uniref:Retropepsin-like domain-containing protein n=1 Tax=Terrihalobacillus insolitus TaxID=2950438 RepID=A0A9X3WT12_9BACI|nr:aspartyl protease family protein [Terrihalobacillus insolitus]MDC3413175.1 retropepsin-like domain-containing protein [Terrihalobacillus insolitus]MDC3425165.1 retropepsin-like domain-containing protein [Terrihalobacillus insolitus]